MPRARGVYSRTHKHGEVRWYVRLMIEGKYQQMAPFGGFLTEKDASRFALHARADLQRGKFFPEHFLRERLPLKDLLIEQTGRLPHTPNRKNDRGYQQWWIAHYGQDDARTLPPSLIDQARQRLAAQGLRPQTIHHYIKFLRCRCNLAMRDGLLQRSPFQSLTLPPPQNLRVRFFSDAERRRLARALPQIWREASELAGLTGLRWTEQFTLTRDRINLTEGYIWLPTPKGGKPQARLLNARARKLIKEQLARHTSPYLYPSATGHTPIQYSNWRKRIWAPACTAAGLTDVRWNDWRHTFASDLTMAGHSDRTVAALLGHRSTQMVTRYAHLSTRHLRAAIEGLSPSKKTK